MRVNGVTVVTAALVGLAIGVFATGRVGGVVLPLLFVLASPLLLGFVRASVSGSRDDEPARTTPSPGTSAPVEGAAPSLASSPGQRAFARPARAAPSRGDEEVER